MIFFYYNIINSPLIWNLGHTNTYIGIAVENNAFYLVDIHAAIQCQFNSIQFNSIHIQIQIDLYTPANEVFRL